MLKSSWLDCEFELKTCLIRPRTSHPLISKIYFHFNEMDITNKNETFFLLKSITIHNIQIQCKINACKINSFKKKKKISMQTKMTITIVPKMTPNK